MLIVSAQTRGHGSSFGEGMDPSAEERSTAETRTQRGNNNRPRRQQRKSSHGQEISLGYRAPNCARTIDGRFSARRRSRFLQRQDDPLYSRPGGGRWL